MNMKKTISRKTKIVATLGPASETPDRISQLIQSGADVFRLNFSHGTHHWHREMAKSIRRQSHLLNKPLAIMQDLQGPRLRTGRLENSSGCQLTTNTRVIISPGSFRGTARRIATDYADLPIDVNPGERVVLSDGLIELVVRDISGQDVSCEVVSGGWLRENQGINLPDAELSTSPPTKKDIDDIQLGLECGVDYIAMSFVSRAEEIHKLRAEIEKTAALPAERPAIVAKIERPQAVANIEPIIHAADAVMVARGDLGIEMNPEEVPRIQKHIIKSANNAVKPVITATQMLDSMIRNPRPTRAETSDVANAILDGSDAVMLSGETAIGEYPVETVKMMSRIAVQTEPILPPARQNYQLQRLNDPHSLAQATCRIAGEIGAKAIIVFTMTGTTARYVSRQRTSFPVYALTPVKKTYNQLALVWGVTPLRFPLLENTDDMISLGMQKLEEKGIAAPGDKMVCIAGPSTQTPGGTDMVELLKFPVVQ